MREEMSMREYLAEIAAKSRQEEEEKQERFYNVIRCLMMLVMVSAYVAWFVGAI